MSRIISMCTYSYNKWIPTFCYSLKHFNPKIQITIYLINYPQNKVNILRNEFPYVEFLEKQGDYPLKETFNVNKDAYKVTFLKGQLIKECIKIHNEDVLWIDITSLIRTNLDDVFELLDKNDVVLIQRDPNVTKGTRAFAAEIFGISAKNQLVIDYYEKSCNSMKQLWYADQLSLCEFPTEKKAYLEFQVFCNFYYSQDARTWSDRGKKGQGKIEVDDADYTINKYLTELDKYYLNFKGTYERILSEFNKDKPKILVFIDDDKWCYYTTVLEVTKRLANEFEFTIVRNLELDKQLVRKWEGDFIWARCGAYRAVKVLLLKPHYQNKIITTITTGGGNALPVVERHMRVGKNHLGVFTQNQITKDILIEKGFKGKIYFIPNGVDIERFKPKEKDFFNVGFAGRKADAAADRQKGYSEFIKPSVEELQVPFVYADSQYAFIPHSEMHKFYDGVKVLTQISLNEGCSNTVLEAQASGIPCIITRVGYHGEVCKDKVDCLFVERDQKQVVEAIKELRDNPKLYDKISKGAREFAEKHTWDTQAEKVRLVFREILNMVKK